MSQILLFLVYPSVLFYSLKVTGLSCRQERSKRGFALFYKNYSSSFKDDHPECVSLCVNNPNCMSLNYWLNSKKCELNTLSRVKQTQWNSIPIPLIKNLPNSMKPDRIEEKIDLRVGQTFVYAVYMQQDTLFKTLSITGKPWNISVCKLPSLKRETFTST